MLETPEEIDRLQDLLDRSAGGAGPHLRGIIADDRRLTATQACDLLQGLRLHLSLKSPSRIRRAALVGGQAE